MKDSDIEILEKIGAVLRQKREAIGASRGDIADLSHLGEMTLTAIENGDLALTVEMFFELAAALQSSAPEILAEANI